MSRTNGKSKARNDDDEMYTVIFHQMPPNFDWQTLKDRVRAAGGRFPGNADVYAPLDDGNIIGYCKIKGREDAHRCYRNIVNQDLDGYRVYLGLFKMNSDGELEMIEQPRWSQGLFMRPTTNFVSPVRSSQFDAMRRNVSSIVYSKTTDGWHRPPQSVLSMIAPFTQQQYFLQYLSFLNSVPEMGGASETVVPNVECLNLSGTPASQSVSLFNVSADLGLEELRLWLSQHVEGRIDCTRTREGMRVELSSNASARQAQRILDKAVLNGVRIIAVIDPPALAESYSGPRCLNPTAAEFRAQSDRLSSTNHNTNSRYDCNKNFSAPVLSRHKQAKTKPGKQFSKTQSVRADSRSQQDDRDKLPSSRSWPMIVDGSKASSWRLRSQRPSKDGDDSDDSDEDNLELRTGSPRQIDN